MSEIESGGYVYPAGINGWGITRRDWLAGLAMQGMLSNCPDDTAGAVESFKAIPKMAYMIADAMIAEGKKGDNEQNP